MTDDEQAAGWHVDAATYGWSLDHIRAPWPWRVWGVRHIRYWWHVWHAANHAGAWARVGVGLGGVSAYDVWVLYAIRRGWA